jgi:beta-lactamase class A
VDVPLRELLRLSTSESDGTACDTLLRIAGGPAAITRHLQQLGIRDVIVADTERTLGADHAAQYRNYATPAAAVQLLQALHEARGLQPTTHALLLQHMTETPTGPLRLKGLLPPGTKVAHKTGTSGTRDGVTAATNDIGIITLPGGRHLAIAVFVADSPASQEIRERTIARLAQAAYQHFTR